MASSIFICAQDIENPLSIHSPRKQPANEDAFFLCVTLCPCVFVSVCWLRAVDKCVCDRVPILVHCIHPHTNGHLTKTNCNYAIYFPSKTTRTTILLCSGNRGKTMRGNSCLCVIAMRYTLLNFFWIFAWQWRLCIGSVDASSLANVHRVEWHLHVSSVLWTSQIRWQKG